MCSLSISYNLFWCHLFFIWLRLILVLSYLERPLPWTVFNNKVLNFALFFVLKSFHSNALIVVWVLRTQLWIFHLHASWRKHLWLNWCFSYQCIILHWIYFVYPGSTLIFRRDFVLSHLICAFHNLFGRKLIKLKFNCKKH